MKNKETLEEAKKYAELSYYGDEVDAFVRGVKWQAERMYIEEDLENKTLLAMISIMQEYSIINESSVVQFHKEWFEQFKKK